MSTIASTGEGSGGPTLLWPCQVMEMPQRELAPNGPIDSRPDLATSQEGRALKANLF